MSTMSVTRSLVLSVIAAFALSPFFATSAQQAGSDTAPAADSGGADFSPPQIILGTQKQPEFPPAAWDARYTGSVLVELTVQKDGTVGEVKVIECTRPKVGFEKAASDAVKKWKFQPGLEDGEPIEVKTRIKLNFTRLGSGNSAKPQVSAGSFSEARAPMDRPQPRSPSRGQR